MLAFRGGAYWDCRQGAWGIGSTPPRGTVMADKRGVITGPHPDGGWQNKSDGASRASSRHATKAEAVARGKQIAKRRGVEHRIQPRPGGSPRPTLTATIHAGSKGDNERPVEHA